jgi:hypothetical protein
MRRLLSPFYILVPLFLLALPLAVCAFFTTTVAVITLTVRVSIVYFELALALLQAYIFPAPAKAAVGKSRSRHASPHRVRSRRSSAVSNSPSQDGSLARTPRLNNKSASFVSLVGTGEATRDYEGVGGWRLSNGDDDEAVWMGINSRLELPAIIPKRNHHRSLTGGSQSPRYSWSPIQSRARTPIHFEEKHTPEGYFSAQPSTGAAWARSSRENRRASTSGSSVSGDSRSRRASVASKTPGEQAVNAAH